jgi:hypothetical protein
MNTKSGKHEITLSFDIGHSSIGWCVLSPLRPDPDILGCGTVIFPKDDCLASARRGHRRTRRNIRATRKRIAQMRKLLLHLGVLDATKLDAPGHPAPHVLAARALMSNGPSLTWQDLWHVLRWYAHNRGYDGNARWAREEADDDTEKEKAAQCLMETHGTQTMAETVCAVLGIQPIGGKISSNKPFKTHNAAFPRKIVRDEVLAILRKHVGHLPKLDEAVTECLIQEDMASSGWRSIPVPDIKLPDRYQGGLLFGQLVPRFDNRIISICPISGEKVPNKSSREFLEYRWAMLLANIRVDGRFLTPDERGNVHGLMQSHGRLTPVELGKYVGQMTGSKNTNIKASFEIHPDSKDALVLDPVKAFCAKAAQPPGKKSRFEISMFWPHLPDVVRKRAEGRWRKRRRVDLYWMRDQLKLEGADVSALEATIESAWNADQKNRKPIFLTKGHLLRKHFSPEWPSGRAPYSRKVMREVSRFVLDSARHPTEVGGPIYRSPEILKAERERPLTGQTNNHLIRHRLVILDRLTQDIIKHYAGGDSSRITDIVVEVARDLRDFSGMDAEEMSGELTKRLKHFKNAVAHLEKNAPDLKLTGSLIRKCRIAMDLNWTCPFTGQKYDPYDLPKMEREHIIPYADRPTNALDSQVLTYDWVNREKGKRTAMRFILDMANDERFLSPSSYRLFVEKLVVAKKEAFPDDHNRQSQRKRWLLMEDYDLKSHGFTMGALTQTSHLNRLAQRQLEKIFSDQATGICHTRLHALPGQVTAEARKSWNLLGTLALACPECAGKTKTEIREITHLHHALDAATSALIQHYLPGFLPGQRENEKGLLWRALLQRDKSDAEIALLLQTGIFKRTERTGRAGEKRKDAILIDLPADLKQQLAHRLAETRVVQHIPADQSGAILEQNPWRVRAIHGDPEDPQTIVHICQRKSTVDQKIRSFENKEKTVRASRLVGLKSGKLQKNKSALVISENFGMALEPKPMVIPFHKVHMRLKKLKSGAGNTGQFILRKGTLIRLATNPPQNRQNYSGFWRVDSCKDNKQQPALDIVRPAYIKPINGVEWSGMNKNIGPFLKAGLEILRPPLTGLDLSKPG